MASEDLIVEELGDIADGIQAMEKEHPRHARQLQALSTQLDIVSNHLDNESKKNKSRSGSRRQAAAPDIEDGMWPCEDELQDSYEFDPADEHKTPIGYDGLSKAIDKNVPDVVGDLQFAQNTDGKDKHRILIQADRRQSFNRNSSWPFRDLHPGQIQRWAESGQWGMVRRAASMALSHTQVSGGQRTAAFGADLEVDVGRFGAEDNLSTADLGESGNEDITKPVDYDEEGGTLQFFGTYPQKSQDDGPDSGHHRRNVPPPNRERSSARTFLERVADRPVRPEVKNPDDLLNDEDGDNVECDQVLGGLSGQYKGRKSGRSVSGREVDVRVYRPTHVPAELHGLWHRAAQRVAAQGRLLLSSGDIDYYAIDDTYREAVQYCRKKAAQNLMGRRAAQVRYSKTPSSVDITRPKFVPRELVSYWNGSAQALGQANRLVTASGKIDYDSVNRRYIAMLDRVASIPTD
jgi:hypothetical protein